MLRLGCGSQLPMSRIDAPADLRTWRYAFGELTLPESTHISCNITPAYATPIVCARGFGHLTEELFPRQISLDCDANLTIPANRGSL